MRIACIQTYCTEDIAANLDRYAVLTREAAANGADLVCYQELFNSVYFAATADAANIAKYMQGYDLCIEAMTGLARECGIWLAPALCQPHPEIAGQYYNAVVMIDPGGTVRTVHRKTYIPLSPNVLEKNYFTEGNIFCEVTEIAGAKVAFLLCYDRHFPELARIAMLKGADALVIPAATKSVQRKTTWHAELITRSVENLNYTIGINRVGKEGPFTYFGETASYDPSGFLIAKLDDEEGILYTDVDPAKVREARVTLGHLRDLRADVFQELAERIKTLQ
ncbi:carbon-nitrogen hydrolase family protein [Desulfovibrio sp. OttesenSCG-928-O18]|nr:carbon-nitrogen hydrolase family protein [Desulfovibrio sp. OttesenSCG-928-O18]